MDGIRNWFSASVILFGAYALFAQVILLREFLVVFYGNEICLGLIFFGWLLWIAVGAWSARKVAHLLDRSRSHRIWLVSLSLMPLLLPVQIISIRMLRGVLNVPAGEWIPFSAMSISVLFILAPVGFLIGLSFPAACRVLAEKGAGAVAIGRIYIYEALGSLFGGAALTFFLIDHLSPIRTAALGGFILTLSLLPLTIRQTNRDKRTLFLWLLLVLASQAILYSVGSRLNHYTAQKRWEYFGHGQELKVSVDSRYQNISVGYAQGQYTVFGNGLLAYSFPDEYSFAALAHLALSEHPAPASLLLIGGGEGGLIREILKHPIRKLDYVELDPGLIRTVEPFLTDEDRKALGDPRVALHFSDGRHFVKLAQGRYDVVLINVPDPDTAMLNRYYTLDFFEEVKSILSSDGMVFLGLTSTGNFTGREVVSYGRSVYRTLKQAFPYVVAAPGPPQSFFASVSENVVTSDPAVLSARFAEREIESETFSPFLFEQIFPEERVQALEAVLEQEGKERLNTDLHPVTYFYNLILWGRYSGSSFANLLASLESMAGYSIFAPLLVLLLIYVGVRSRTNIHSAALFTIASTGFYGLSVEIILLFLFQNLYGYVYQKIGLIVALFMLGLALGGTLANRMLTGRMPDVLSRLKWSDGAILVLVLLTPWLPVLSRISGMPVDMMLYTAMVVIGVTAGFQFPMVSAVCMENGMGQARAAASIDSRDHLGACAGALLTGVLFVPLLGIAGTCYLIAGIKGVSLVGLFLRE